MRAGRFTDRPRGAGLAILVRRGRERRDGSPARGDGPLDGRARNRPSLRVDCAGNQRLRQRRRDDAHLLVSAHDLDRRHTRLGRDLLVVARRDGAPGQGQDGGGAGAAAHHLYHGGNP